MKALIGFGSVAILALVGVFMYISANNKDARLRNQGSAKQKANTTSFDNCWKTVQQLAQVTDKFKGDFKDVFVSLNESKHYGKGGSLFKFITEANPAFDQSLYMKLANAIESHRADFTRDQKALIDIKREHDDLRTTIPSSWFVGGRPEMEITIVTSSKTEETFKSGKEDDVEIFKK